MTIDRLLVLLLSLSFLLLAPPAAAYDHDYRTAGITVPERTDDIPVPSPATLPDDAGLFLLATAPEAPPPTGTDDGGGNDGMALPAIVPLLCCLHAGLDAAALVLADKGLDRTLPWATGPPRA